MNLPPLVYRVGGVPLTAAQHDSNLRTIRDFVNALSALFGVALEADGTLKAGAVDSTGVLADRIITNAKMDWLFNFYTRATGTGTYTATIGTDIGFSNGDGLTTSLVVFVKFLGANTITPCTLNINSKGAVTIKKNGTEDLAIGDIAAGQIYCLAFDGTNYQIMGRLARNSAISSITSIQGAGSGNPLGFASTNLATASMVMPTGCTTWSWVKVVFTTHMCSSYSTGAGSIRDFLVKAGGATMSWVGSGPPAGQFWDNENDDDGLVVKFDSEGVPTGHTTDNPLVLDVYANYDLSRALGDIVARRSMYAVGYAI